MSKDTSKNLECKRIFIGSPGDITNERQIFRDVIEKVNKIKAKSMGVLLEPIGWEDTVPGKGRPQEKINEDVRRADLVILLIWNRWGSPTGEFSSGFEEEYEVASKDGKEIWLYFRDVSEEMLADPGEQFKQVLQFRDKIEKEKQFLYRRYEEEKTFGNQFLDHMCSWLDGISPVSISKMSDELLRYQLKIEQLQNEISEVKTEQSKIADVWAKEAQEHADSGRLTKAEEYFARALALYPSPTVINFYALFLIRIGALNKAEDKLRQLIQICEASDVKIFQAAGYTNLGIIYSTRGDLKAAEKMHNQALAINEELGRKDGMAANYGNLGIIYSTRGDLKVAEKMYNQALAIDEDLGHKEGMARCYTNLGLIYKTRGDLKAAEKMFNQSLTICEELGQKQGLAINYGNLGIIYGIRGDLKAAEKMFNQALTINKELGHKEGMAVDYANLGTFHKVRGDLKAAKKKFNQALALYEAIGNKPEVKRIKSFLRQLKKLLEKNRKYKK